MEITFTISNDEKLIRAFEDLPHAAQDRVIKPLMIEASDMIAQAEKGEAPSESGLLQTSLGHTQLKNYGGKLFITTGVRRGFRRAVTVNRRGGLRFRSKAFTEANIDIPARDPAKYLRLVEHGRKESIAGARPGSYYGNLGPERGLRGRFIEPDAERNPASKVLYSAASDKFFGRSVAAAAPNPFIERTYESNKQKIADFITLRGEEGIIAEAKQLIKF
jgi:hypothetical protein